MNNLLRLTFKTMYVFLLLCVIVTVGCKKNEELLSLSSSLSVDAKNASFAYGTFTFTNNNSNKVLQVADSRLDTLNARAYAKAVIAAAQKEGAKQQAERAAARARQNQHDQGRDI